MSLPSWWSLARHTPVLEFAREDGTPAAVERRRREAGIEDRNVLTAEKAVASIRAIQAKALRRPLPDSTPLIRADRDNR
ncbi:hypothetical protein Q8W71_10855 [Methylobacterium sp. NEAU 140]|uniref:hypothetical protein n=1 Tax=Methylobacterium sp. NEAU 140 TaxID=3064945 RepID=UPI002732D981|nr:hypothetical protein [Methylobacterium sp. NEAU 140]MDP4023124.1 hypothetical protein [Methylobacterium sp. NEAU 140]